jgi:hypothetical protein
MARSLQHKFESCLNFSLSLKKPPAHRVPIALAHESPYRRKQWKHSANVGLHTDYTSIHHGN